MRCSIDVENGVISFVQRKTSTPALIGLHDDLKDWITRQAAPDDPEAFLFPSLANRSADGRRGLSNAFQGIMEKAGVSGRILRERSGKGTDGAFALFSQFPSRSRNRSLQQCGTQGHRQTCNNPCQQGIATSLHPPGHRAIRAATNLISRLPKPQE